MRNDGDSTLDDEMKMGMIWHEPQERSGKSKMKKVKPSKNLRGNAAQFYVAAELSRRNIIAAITLGNCPDIDILCSDSSGKRFAHIQVKAFPLEGGNCPVGLKATKEYGDNFFWVLVGFPRRRSRRPRYFIIPSGEMSMHIKAYFDLWSKAPGKSGKPHNKNSKLRTVRVTEKNRDGWDIAQYRSKWRLIEDVLKTPDAAA